MTPYYKQNCEYRGSYFKTTRTNELQEELTSKVREHQRSLDAGFTLRSKRIREELEKFATRFDVGTVELEIARNAYNRCAAAHQDFYMRASPRYRHTHSHVDLSGLQIEAPTTVGGQIAMGLCAIAIITLVVARAVAKAR